MFYHKDLREEWEFLNKIQHNQLDSHDRLLHLMHKRM